MPTVNRCSGEGKNYTLFPGYFDEINIANGQKIFNLTSDICPSNKSESITVDQKMTSTDFE